MKGIICYLTIFLIFVLETKSQGRISDNIYIRALEGKLAKAKGDQRVNLLNDICHAWQRNMDPELTQKPTFGKIKSDSGYYYATLALAESRKNNYQTGEGMALVNMAEARRLKGWWDDNGFPRKVTNKQLDSAVQLLDQATTLLDKTTEYHSLGHLYLLKEEFDRKRAPEDRQSQQEHLTYIDKGLKYLHLAGNTLELAENGTWASLTAIESGYLEQALNFSLQGFENAKKWISGSNKKSIEWKHYLVTQSLYNLSDISNKGGDYSTAMSYLKEMNNYIIANNLPWEPIGELCELYIEMGNVDSAMKYQKLYSVNNPRLRYANLFLGKINIIEKKYDDVIRIVTPLLDSFTVVSDPKSFIESCIVLGKAHQTKGEQGKALQYSYWALDKGTRMSRRSYMYKVYELMALAHRSVGTNDSAYIYLYKYVKLKDSIQNSQLRWQLHKARKDASVALLLKDNQYQASEIKRQAQVKNILLAAMLLLLIAGALIWRNIILRKKYEQLEMLRRQTELQKQTQDLEMKALKAQMNPHFIFNSLSSINWFILKNKTQEASDYLTSFSRLIRMVLTNSDKPVISLDEELKMLRLYLDMEQLRLEHSFDYKIEMMNNIDPAEIYMPPMILQPFCENAIWHGLSHKTEKGVLTVNFELQEHLLNCTIADNGVGRQKADQLKNSKSHKEKSLGIQITKSRLSLFNGAQQESEYYNIEDVVDEKGIVDGTKVTLKIKSKEVA